jgi:hypothetical protein
MTMDRSSHTVAMERQISLNTQRFYNDLMRRVKHFQPKQFIPWIVGIMREYHRQNRHVTAPQFQIGIAIEANCAYHCKQTDRELTHKEYAKIKNLFHAQEQPEMKALLERDFGNYFLVMHRQQIELQKSFAQLDIARYRRLFVKDNPLPKLSKAFYKHFGITPENWIKASIAIFSTGLSNPQGKLSIRITDPQLNLEVDMVKRYANEASYTVQQVGDRFRRTRDETRPQYHACIRSVFIDHPLISMGEQEYVAPFLGTIFHHSATGLHQRMLKMPHFDTEFGRSMERYVELVGRSATKALVVATGGELSKRAMGKSCDLLIEFDTYILILESKSAIFTRDVITPNTIPNDNSTRKISTAITQLYQTAYDISQDRFCDLGVSSEKPVYGSVVTFGEVPFANAPWYYGRYLFPKAEEKLEPPIYPSDNMPETPLVLTLEGFERLIMLLCTNNVTLPTLIEEKNILGYGKTGEWDMYLGQLATKEEGILRHLTYLEDDCNEFYESLGVNKDKKLHQ